MRWSRPLLVSLVIFAGCRTPLLPALDDFAAAPAPLATTRDLASAARDLASAARDLALPGDDLALLRAPDLATARPIDLAGCAGAPVVHGILHAPDWYFPCEAITLVGENLDCLGTTVLLEGAQTLAATVLGPGAAPGQLRIRLPLITDGHSPSTLTVTNPVATVRSKVAVASDGAPAGVTACVAPAACAGPPSLASPSSFSPQIQTPCHPFAIWGANLGCSGATVSVGGVQMIVADAWMGPAALGVRLPAGVEHAAAAPVQVNTTRGTVTSGIDFNFASAAPIDAAVCN